MRSWLSRHLRLASTLLRRSEPGQHSLSPPAPAPRFEPLESRQFLSAGAAFTIDSPGPAAAAVHVAPFASSGAGYSGTANVSDPDLGQLNNVPISFTIKNKNGKDQVSGQVSIIKFSFSAKARKSGKNWTVIEFHDPKTGTVVLIQIQQKNGKFVSGSIDGSAAGATFDGTFTPTK
jgi:hypothetical protein